jgi:hypothetical protein
LQRTIASPGLTTRSADRRHMRAIATDHFPPLTSGDARLVGSEFVCATLSVSGFSALARDFALLAGVHRRESSIALRSIGVVRRRRHLTFLLDDRAVNRTVTRATKVGRTGFESVMRANRKQMPDSGLFEAKGLQGCIQRFGSFRRPLA